MGLKYYLLIVITFFVCNEMLSQNVGIGTTTPVSKLTVKTPINTAGYTHVGGNDSIIVTEGIGGVSASFGTTTNHALRLNTNGLGRLHIYPAGEVIIGTNTTPAVGRLTVETPNNSDGISHISTSGNILMTRMGGTSAGIGTFSNTNMRLFANSNSALIIDAANGNIGIGTDAPTAKLHIGGNQKIDGANTLEFGAGNSKEINAGKIGYSTFTNGALDILGAGTTVASRQIKFWNEGGAEFNGNIGIGTPATYGVRLHINQDLEALRLSGNQPYMTLFNGTTFKGYLRSIGADNIELGTAPGNTNGTLNLTSLGVPRLSINSSGQVAINGSPGIYFSPNLSVTGSGYGGGLSIKNGPGGDEWYIRTNYDLGFTFNSVGKAFVDPVTGDWNAYSDINLKENILPYKPVLKHIRNLNVTTYHYKADKDNNRSFGLIAQNVAQYFPEVVSETKDKDGKKILGIAYGKTGVLAIKAIQEQQEIIEQQRERFESLEKRLALIEKILNTKQSN
jgi:hypothetical protein